jgi:hypothetical protein
MEVCLEVNDSLIQKNGGDTDFLGERSIMSSLTISLIVFACVFGGGLLGLFLHAALPERHLSADSKTTVTLGVGLIGTMAALVLGLLISSAASSFDTQRNELTEGAAKVVLLDHVLGHYGPDAKEARALLRSTVASVVDRVWPEGASRRAQLEPNAAGGDILYEKILELSPKDDTQRTLKAQALNIALELVRTRWMMIEQQGVSISTPFLVVVVFWLTIIFISFGLFAPPNATVTVTFFVCALSVSSAIFLILEMYSPFTGLIQISSTPLRNALAHLGH